MTSFASRCLPVLCLSLLLTACQSSAPQPYQVPVDDSVNAFRQLEQDLGAGRLGAAESQLVALQQTHSGDTRLEMFQRQLVEAYLQQGNGALQSGDLNTATQALSRARSLMPQAPALTTGLDSAIAKARDEQLAQARLARQASEQAAARAEAERLEQARQLRLAAERQKLVVTPISTPAPAAVAAPKQPRLIDPAAGSSTVALAMLDAHDNDSLRSVLDAVAQDVVNFDCSVRVDVREAKDFPWVAALLSARVKKIDPAYALRLTHSLQPEQTPQLLLSPRR